MVALLDQLRRLKSQPVTIEFVDGEVVDAVLLEVDTEEHDDIVFDVTAVRKRTEKTAYDARNVYTAPISSVRRVELRSP